MKGVCRWFTSLFSVVIKKSLGQKSNLQYKKRTKRVIWHSEFCLVRFFCSNLSILKIYNKEFLKSKSFCLRLFVLNEVANRQRLEEACLNNAQLILVTCLSGTSLLPSTRPSIRLTIHLSWSWWEIERRNLRHNKDTERKAR